MRILHTADWHLGRSFAGFDLLAAQRHALDGLAAIAAAEQPHAIVLAGDIYDRSVPPEDAVLEFDGILMRLAAVAPVLAIAGNHDSGGRIDFGRRLLRQAGVHIAGTSRQGVERVDLRDEHGTVAFHLMPFATPEDARFELGRNDLRTHDDATRARIATLDLTGTSRHVLVGHLFVQGGRETRDSERDISVGGVATVDPAAFSPFTYTALGHLHRPHTAGSDRVRYSGSLARYSFAEEDHDKSVSLVEIDAAGGVAVREIPLPQKYGMRTLRGTFDDLRIRAVADDRRDLDLVRIVVTDPLLPPGTYDHFRKLYPRLLEFTHERPRAATPAGGPADTAPRRSEREFLDAFFANRYSGDVGDDIRDLAHECLDKAVRNDEESP
jgi:exonuclease SbcD